MIPVLVEGVKELKADGEAKDVHIDRKDRQITELTRRIDQLEALLTGIVDDKGATP